jgi:polysaccharide chain length determinant protein (PEP-CTERM system associated)
MKEQIESLLSAIRSAWRFRWTALWVAWLVAIAGTVLNLALPNKYQSRAQIYLDTRSVLGSLLQGLAVTPQTQNQTDAVRRALLARPSLDRVARKVGLYQRTHSAEGAERLLTELADLISIRAETEAGIYTITYSDGDPRTAQAVVRTLLDTFMENSLGAGRTDTQSAESFLKQQVAQYETALSQSEQRLAEFKKKHIGLMPDQRGDYFGRLQAEVANLQKIHSDLAVAVRQRDELRRKISGDESGRMLLKSPPSAQEIQAATALDARIRESKRQLDEFLLKFTDRHPEVIAAKDTIKRLEEQRRAELGGVRSTNGTVAEGSVVPVDPVVQNLQIGLNTADVQMAALQAQESQSAARVAELQRLVTTGPEIEAELARLNRDYGVTKTQYEALLQRLGSARLSNQADRSEDRRFRILEQPRAPLRPISPNRPLFLVATLAAALFAGVGVAFLRSQTRPVFVSRNALAAATGLPVIGVVSRSRAPAALGEERREAVNFAMATIVLVVVIVTTGLVSYPVSRLLRAAIGLEGA